MSEDHIPLSCYFSVDGTPTRTSFQFVKQLIAWVLMFLGLGGGIIGIGVFLIGLTDISAMFIGMAFMGVGFVYFIIQKLAINHCQETDYYQNAILGESDKKTALILIISLILSFGVIILIIQYVFGVPIF